MFLSEAKEETQQEQACPGNCSIYSRRCRRKWSAASDGLKCLHPKRHDSGLLCAKVWSVLNIKYHFWQAVFSEEHPRTPSKGFVLPAHPPRHRQQKQEQNLKQRRRRRRQRGARGRVATRTMSTATATAETAASAAALTFLLPVIITVNLFRLCTGVVVVIVVHVTTIMIQSSSACQQQSWTQSGLINITIMVLLTPLGHPANTSNI